MQVLVIKTSSLGDIIHTLPALSDAKRVYPELTFDWVVEEAFQEVPFWHPAVRRVIPIALRRWRKKIGKPETLKEIVAFTRMLREKKYDIVIDAQGLLKSAFLTVLSRHTKRFGFSWKSAREALASVFYQKRMVVPWGLHAVMRSRSLFAQSLGYWMPDTNADYGIRKDKLASTIGEPSRLPYYVFLHGTTWETKQWPEKYWQELARIVTAAGYHVQLLWNSEQELARARRIAGDLKKVVVNPDRLKLTEIMRLLAEAQGIVTADTGLGHLAAALSVPTISLYSATDPAHSGTWGKNQQNLKVNFACAPCYQRICRHKDKQTSLYPPCFASLPPSLVWAQLNQLTGN